MSKYPRLNITDDEQATVTAQIMEYYLEHGALFVLGSTRSFTLPAADVNGNPGRLQFELEGAEHEVRVFSYSKSTLSNEYSICVHEIEDRDVSSSVIDTNNIEEFSLFQPNRAKPDSTFDGTFYNLTGADVNWFQRLIVDSVETTFDVTLAVDETLHDIVITEGASESTSYANGTLDVVINSGNTYNDSDIQTLISSDADVSSATVSGQGSQVGSSNWVGTVRMEHTQVSGDYYITQGEGGPQAADTGIVASRSTSVKLHTTHQNYLFCINNLDDASSRDFAIQIVMGIEDYL